MTTLQKIIPIENINMSTLGAKKWLKRLDGILIKNMNDIHIDNKTIASELQISERQLFRKMKILTGLSPQKYLKIKRLNQAMQLLQAGEYRTVKEISLAVGYTKSNYFSLQFEKEFGKKPMTILRELGWR